MTNAVQLAQYGSVQNSFKNRIINGGMVIDQRNAGASVTPPAATSTYILDRWFALSAAASKFTVQQTPSATETGYATRVGAGFRNYLAVTSSAATTPAATDEYLFQQKIEGFNAADLAWGTSDAKTITLSFLVYSSLTGTFGGAIQNSASNRVYVFSYTIPTANTWTQISVTIAGDTSGTWLTTNGIGIRVGFDLGSGTTYKGTAGSWGSTFYNGVTGGVNVIGTNGATFYITGVQLEKGSTATSFDYRPYGTELALCQRYFLKTNPDNASRCGGMWGSMLSTTTGHPTGSLPVAMRTAPTVVRGGTNDTFCVSGISATSAGTFSNFSSTTITIDSEVTGMSTSAIGYPVQYNGQLSLSSEL